MEANLIADFGCPLFEVRAWTTRRTGLLGTRYSYEPSRTIVQAASVEGDGLAVSRQARRMHVAADDRPHRQPLVEGIHRPYQPRERHGSTPLSTHGPNGLNLAASMHDARPWHSHAAGRMNQTSHAMEENAGLPGTRPDNDHGVSRCPGSDAGAGSALCIGRYIETEQGARIQTASLADVDQLAGAGRAPLVEVVCPCNVRDPSGIPRDSGRDADNRGMDRWQLVSLAVCQSPHGHHDHGRSYDEADDARRHRGGGADSSFCCTSHSQESG
jgi:hypothetical protein